MTKRNAIKTAKCFIDTYFPHCFSALLAGSIVRGEETTTSDLDLVVFTVCEDSYRYSCMNDGWPIEVFVHNNTSYLKFLQSDYERAKPALAKMITEGIVLREEEGFKNIKRQAADYLSRGPALWDEKEIEQKRYFITDVLDDFQGCQDRAEALFIVQTLVERVVEFYLRVNGQWIGDSKWMWRALKTYDRQLSSKLADCLDEYYMENKKERFISLTNEILLPYGGRLFAGYARGKEDRRRNDEENR